MSSNGMPAEIAAQVAHFPSCTCGHNVVNHHMLNFPIPDRPGWTTVTRDRYNCCFCRCKFYIEASADPLVFTRAPNNLPDELVRLVTPNESRQSYQSQQPFIKYKLIARLCSLLGMNK